MTSVTGDSFDAKNFLQHCSTHPGVYQMLDAEGDVLYVGKAKNLKKRISSYFKQNLEHAKTRALVSHINAIEVTVTQSETQALLLENQLIKSLRPRYNVIFKDDKSYPYLYLSNHMHYPRLGFYRGVVESKQADYFGPYTSAGSARESLNLLQKLFKLRSCEDSFFKNRTRPCLQYQIKRCTAPCVHFIEPDAYQQDVRHARMFLQGKNNQVIHELAQQMEVAAEELNFERAGVLRDQIALLRRIQEQQCIMSSRKGDADVIGFAQQYQQICVLVLFIRQGSVIGQKAYFPKNSMDATQQESITEFISQHYLAKEHHSSIPHELILPCAIEDSAWFAQGLTEVAEHKVEVLSRVQQKKQQWLHMALENAIQALKQYIADKSNTLQRLEDLANCLGLSAAPERIECFDISHTMGEAAVASCVVLTREGLMKQEYRRFNITGIEPGDDYAAMEQALLRRYKAIKEAEGILPDLIIIDGGKGQLARAQLVMQTLQLTDIQLLGVAKGPARKPGHEQLFLESQGEGFSLEATLPALHVIQLIRDEAHRFAITGHRQRRAKKRTTSSLEAIPGIGAKRRRELLRQFGGLQELQRASMEDIAKIPGISHTLAQKIYEALHGM